MSISAKTRRWTRLEYERLIDLGVFRPDERLELIAGWLTVREPQGGPHSMAMELVGDALRLAFGRGWRVRAQLPVALDDESEPEPDCSVVAGTARKAIEPIPSRPALIVEIADTSLPFDRHFKGSMYARAQVQDYWIVNLVDRVLEVYRQPSAAAETPYGWRYADIQRLAGAASIVPLALRRVHIAVADMIP
jgi:Uma2 family endonuclease